MTAIEQLKYLMALNTAAAVIIAIVGICAYIAILYILIKFYLTVYHDAIQVFKDAKKRTTENKQDKRPPTQKEINDAIIKKFLK